MESLYNATTDAMNGQPYRDCVRALVYMDYQTLRIAAARLVADYIAWDPAGAMSYEVCPDLLKHMCMADPYENLLECSEISPYDLEPAGWAWPWNSGDGKQELFERAFSALRDELGKLKSEILKYQGTNGGGECYDTSSLDAARSCCHEICA